MCGCRTPGYKGTGCHKNAECGVRSAECGVRTRKMRTHQEQINNSLLGHTKCGLPKKLLKKKTNKQTNNNKKQNKTIIK